MKRIVVIALLCSFTLHAMDDLFKTMEKTKKAMFQEMPNDVQVSAKVKFHEVKRIKNLFGNESAEQFERSYAETVSLERSLLGWKQTDTTTCESSSKHYQVALILRCSLANHDITGECIIKRSTISGLTEVLSQIKTLQFAIPAEKISTFLKREDVILTDDADNQKLVVTITSK